MTNRTDDELGRLLKETFADKENLLLDSQSARAGTDQLPEATRSRRAPILLAAAAVLVILAGVLYAANPRGGSEPGPGPAGVTASNTQTTQVIPTESLIWAAAIKGILDREQNPTKDPILYILDASHENAGDTDKQVRNVPFTEAQRIGIENALTGFARIEWVRQRGDTRECPTTPQGPYVTVGPIVQKAGHVEVGVNIWRGCLNARWMTLIVAQQGSTWKVTGSTGKEAIS